MALDEVSQLAEDMCFRLDELSKDEQAELMETYFRKYLDKRIELIVALFKNDGTSEIVAYI